MSDTATKDEQHSGADASPGAAIGAVRVRMLREEFQLVTDLERMLRYASTTKSVELPESLLGEAADALQAAKGAVQGGQLLAIDDKRKLLAAIDAVVPRVYPVTPASLAIAEAMGSGGLTGDIDLETMRVTVVATVRNWRNWTVIVLIIVLGVAIAQNIDGVRYKNEIMSVLWPPLVGALGACVFILRNILNHMEARTYVPRESTTYYLRLILGAVLGYIIPIVIFGLTSSDTDQAKLFIAAFLAGYAVEPMFSALDNIVATLRDVVGRTPIGPIAKK